MAAQAQRKGVSSQLKPADAGEGPGSILRQARENGGGIGRAHRHGADRPTYWLTSGFAFQNESETDQYRRSATGGCAQTESRSPGADHCQ